MGTERRGGRGRRGPRGGAPGVGGVLFGENKVVLVFYPGVHPCVAGAGRVGEKLGEEGRVGCVIVGHAVHGGWVVVVVVVGGGGELGESRLCSLDRLALSVLLHLRYILPLTFSQHNTKRGREDPPIQIPPLAFSGAAGLAFPTDISTPPI